MFTPTPDLNALRQGDIISGLYCPLIKNSDLDLIGKITGDPPPSPEHIPLKAFIENKKYVKGMIKLLPTLTIVVSQCCDVEARDGVLDAPAFVLAPVEPLRSLKIAQNAIEVEQLKKNAVGLYTNFFYLDQVSPISEPSFINFNKVFSIHKDDYRSALQNKVLQMTDECRVLFKIKLAHHFGRPTEEEKQNKLYPGPMDSP